MRAMDQAVVGRLMSEKRKLRRDLARIQAFAAELADKYARQSAALSQAAERQGGQARELGRLRLAIGKALEFCDEHVPEQWAGELIQILGGR